MNAPDDRSEHESPNGADPVALGPPAVNGLSVLTFASTTDNTLLALPTETAPLARLNGTHNGYPQRRIRPVRPVPAYRPLIDGRLEGLSDEAISNGTLLATLLAVAHKTARRFRRQLVNARHKRNQKLLEQKAQRGQDITQARKEECVICHFAADEVEYRQCPVCRAIEVLTALVSPEDAELCPEALGEAADEIRLVLPWFPINDRVERLKSWHAAVHFHGEL